MSRFCIVRTKMSQQQPGSSRGSEMMKIKCQFHWWSSQKETTSLQQVPVTDETFAHVYGRCIVPVLNPSCSGVNVSDLSQVSWEQRVSPLHYQCPCIYITRTSTNTSIQSAWPFNFIEFHPPPRFLYKKEVWHLWMTDGYRQYRQPDGHWTECYP